MAGAAGGWSAALLCVASSGSGGSGTQAGPSPSSPSQMLNLNSGWLQAAAREAERLRQEREVQRKQYEGQQVRAEG